MENEYIASIEVSDQIAEDHWEVYRPTLKITGETTVAEIVKWAKQRSGKGLTAVNCPSVIHITALETLPHAKEPSY